MSVVLLMVLLSLIGWTLLVDAKESIDTSVVLSEVKPTLQRKSRS